MRNLNKELENKKIQIDKLLSYGFVKKDNTYIYEKEILDNQFKVVVNITDSEEMTSKVIEMATNDEYLLVDVSSVSGEYVGKLKEEYENILNDIFKNCTIPNIFKSKQAKEVIKYVKEKYNDDLEYLWVKFPNNAVWRNKDNKKWYGALLVLSENKLGIKSDKIIDIIDLRYQKDKIKEIVDNEKFFDGYHMNKDNWITIRLDESVDIKQIYKLIDNSYELSLKK